MWIHKIFLEHQQKRLFNVLLKDLRLHDLEYFFEKFPKVFPGLESHYYDVKLHFQLKDFAVHLNNVGRYVLTSLT